MNVSLPANTISAYYLMDDLTARSMNTADKLVHERTVYWAAIKPNAAAGTTGDTGLYLAKFTTDTGNNVPTSLLWPAIPISTTTPAYTVDWFEKDMMEYQYRLWTQGSGTGAFPDIVDAFNFQRDVRVKRKLDNTDALMMVITSNQPVRFSFVYRSYWSW